MKCYKVRVASSGMMVNQALKEKQPSISSNVVMGDMSMNMILLQHKASELTFLYLKKGNSVLYM